ncbi:hypothetical protein HYH02_006730 [Chlamydomonas schloesseri]|uniref:Uncharacterized protein n=1 Tax=Chlamydomonas schloesseri TaxID=2026947 RepID=A0A836B5I0_9CHLO|nr:hypothetical protein HYH02_006730 [Chlamydomonas schloesseri]|eukprot:KAG2448145.1 hypothetical protein HYH02_006730 [Chlamydomonas schloesseri]
MRAPQRLLLFSLICLGIGLPNTAPSQGPSRLLRPGLPLAAASSHRKPPAAALTQAADSAAAPTPPADGGSSTSAGHAAPSRTESKQKQKPQLTDPGASGSEAGGSNKAAAASDAGVSQQSSGTGSGAGGQTARTAATTGPAAAAAAAAARQECADVPVKATQLELAGMAHTIVTGVVLAAGAGSGHCYPNGTLVPKPDDGISSSSSSSSSATPTSYILLGLQCVHKGLVRCRQHEGDGGDCLILVEAPVLPDSQPCALTGAQRYMFFLQPADPAPGGDQQQSQQQQQQQQQCPGLYYAQFQRAYHTIRRPLGGTGCAFYPAFPPAGDMVQQLSGVCKGSEARCKLDRCDPAVTRSPCANDTAAVCDLKTCAGKFMYYNAIFPDETCYEMYSYVTSGLPVNCYGQRYINNRIREIELQQALANATAAGRAGRAQQPQLLLALSAGANENAAAPRRLFGSSSSSSSSGSIDGRADSHEFEERGGAAAVGSSGRGGRDVCVMHCEAGFGTAGAWQTAQPRLGTWPNTEVGVPRPDVVAVPEPSIFVKETKLPIIGGLTDTTAIEEYDRIKGTADLNDNGNFASMSGM